MYHLGKCCAPCSGKVSREEYHRLLESVSRFLEGHTGPIIELLTEQMQSASENMEYEKAAQLRDRIKAIKSLAEKQQAISVTGSERDIFAFVKDQEDSVVFALFERGGKIIWAESMSIACGGETTGEIMASFLKQHYADGAPVPKEIVVRDMPEDKEVLSEYG